MLQKFDVSRLSIISKLILDFNAMLFLHLIMTLCNKPVHYRVFGTRILLMKKQELWRESLQNSEMRWLLWPLKISPRWILANLYYNWNFLCSYKKKAHTFKNVIFMYFSLLFALLWWCVTSSHKTWRLSTTWVADRISPPWVWWPGQSEWY